MIYERWEFTKEQGLWSDNGGIRRDLRSKRRKHSFQHWKRIYCIHESVMSPTRGIQLQVFHNTPKPLPVGLQNRVYQLFRIEMPELPACTVGCIFQERKRKIVPLWFKQKMNHIVPSIRYNKGCLGIVHIEESCVRTREIHSFRLDFFLGDSGKLGDERRELRSVRVNVCAKYGDCFEIRIHQNCADFDDSVAIHIEFYSIARSVCFQIEDKEVFSFVHGTDEKGYVGLG